MGHVYPQLSFDLLFIIIVSLSSEMVATSFSQVIQPLLVLLSAFGHPDNEKLIHVYNLSVYLIIIIPPPSKEKQSLEAGEIIQMAESCIRKVHSHSTSVFENA